MIDNYVDKHVRRYLFDGKMDVILLLTSPKKIGFGPGIDRLRHSI